MANQKLTNATRHYSTMEAETKNTNVEGEKLRDDFNRTIVVQKPEQHFGDSHITPLHRIATHFVRKKHEIEDLIGGKNVSQYTEVEPDTTSHLDAPLGDLDTKYVMLEEYAHGGHTTVSIARDRNLRRVVAIKSLKKEAETKAGLIDSFVSEAKVTAQLDHPGIIPIYGLSSDGNQGVHLIMKLVNGRTLRDYLRNISLNYRARGIKAFDEDAQLRTRLEIFLHVCDAVAYAHHKNIIHRDLKPENIMLGEFMEVFVVDWGLAKVITKEDDTSSEKESITGTPRYFSPEALRGRHCDARSDIFTMGLILQEIVTMRCAVGGKDEKDYMEHIVNGELEPIEHRFKWHIDKALKAIIQKATAYCPEDRYQSVKELSDDFRRYMGGLSVEACPDNWLMSCLRYFNGHRREFVAGFLAILLLFSAVTAYSIFRQLKVSREMNVQRRAMNYVFNRTGIVSNHIDTTTLHIQEQLHALSRIIAYLLTYNTEGDKDAWHKAFRPTMSEIGKTEPGMFYSPYYKRMTSLDYGICTFAPDADMAACNAFLEKGYPVLRKMKTIVLGSKSDYVFADKDFERLKADYLYNGFPVRSVYVGTCGGAKLLYPWRGNYPRVIDPRKREWYLEAQKKGKPVWGKPYMDYDSVSGLSMPCSVPIYDMKGEFCGVVGLDLSVNKLTNSILSMGNTGEYVLEKAVINKEGETIFSSMSEYFNKSFDPEKLHKDVEFKTPLFGDDVIRRKILQEGKKYGVFSIARNGQRQVYSFAYLDVIDMYYVVVADYNGLVSYIRANNL
ncbi:MAG: protein kinase [Victivallales bacterium]|nr:protein kinase [Victivallales bacterium]